MLFTLSVSLRLANELRLVTFSSELPHPKPWLWCLWGFHCCTGIFVLWSLCFYSKSNWKMDTYSSYWVCKEPKSWTKAWSTGGCLSLRWFSSDFIHFSLTLVKAGQYYCQFRLVNTEKRPVSFLAVQAPAAVGKPTLLKFHWRDLGSLMLSHNNTTFHGLIHRW